MINSKFLFIGNQQVCVCVLKVVESIRNKFHCIFQFKVKKLVLFSTQVRLVLIILFSKSCEIISTIFPVSCILKGLLGLNLIYLKMMSHDEQILLKIKIPFKRNFNAEYFKGVAFSKIQIFIDRYYLGRMSFTRYLNFVA